ncbi:MAG: metal ABC transporter permease [Gammaproteobacteria bacterium AqS3]|nr:metal ABC transporter permease [Gammaproteobacteria bacterium AqS3]
MEPGFVQIAVAGFGAVLMCAVPGCLVVWRRMAYFGDALAHSGMLGVGLGLLFSLPISLMVGLCAAVFAVLLLWLRHRSVFAFDTLLGVLAHAGLAAGLVLISFSSLPGEIHLESFLFGDMASATGFQVGLLYGAGALTLTLLGYFRQELILVSVDPGLARAEGVQAIWVDAMTLLLVALTVALAVRTLGILLVTSVMIIPAAAARQIAASPLQMAWIALLLGAVSVLLGASAHVLWAVPPAAAIVSSAVGLFVLLMIVNRLRG